jgi:hypothetical protein
LSGQIATECALLVVIEGDDARAGSPGRCRALVESELNERGGRLETVQAAGIDEEVVDALRTSET